MKRRTFLGSVAALGLAKPCRALARALPNEPSPNFDFDESEMRFIAGLRPYREDNYRLETERVGEKVFVHNYGHGGAGITMSWGCAHEVRDLVDEALKHAESKRVAVLGAGVMGLTAATLLRRRGYDVTIYSKGYYRETTSIIAGGQFSPSTVAVPDAGPIRNQFDRIIRRSFITHEAHLGVKYGVSRKRNYAWSESSSFGQIPEGVLPEVEYLDRLPFARFDIPGYMYQTLLIEPPIFLAQLLRDLHQARVQMERQIFTAIDDVQHLSEDVVVNCMGLGAGDVMDDPNVKPIKGQLVLLPAQMNLDYLYQGKGYIFPRRDGVVVGGTFEREFRTPDPVREQCLTFLEKAKKPFDGIFDDSSKAVRDDSIYIDEP